MSLIYDESDLAEKEEEINMDKILSEKKEKKSSTAKKKRKPKKDDDDDALAKEALKVNEYTNKITFIKKN